MATTDLKSILDRFQVVLAATPLSLSQSQQAFSHDRQPNGLVQNVFWIEDGGKVSGRSVTNYAEVRIDRLRVFVSKPLAFAGLAQMEAMVQLGDTMYRELVEDGLTQGWNIELDGHRVTQPKNTELLIGSFDFRVDYDFSVATT